MCVLAPNGRRQTVKCSPNTTILQVKIVHFLLFSHIWSIPDSGGCLQEAANEPGRIRSETSQDYSGHDSDFSLLRLTEQCTT